MLGTLISIVKTLLRAVFRGGSCVDGCGTAAQPVPRRGLRLFAAGGLLLAAMAKNSPCAGNSKKSKEMNAAAARAATNAFDLELNDAALAAAGLDEQYAGRYGYDDMRAGVGPAD
ncbi:hypothetical protein EMIHUDRAFT_238518 [Emiliania huxleyi CCMP1516]|uniref:Uncharacterized protein n=2 Tax=Emiliania huxleyi TaxID=2903 RepID=A0A0D3JLK6_EMIH1|nr:hypothetical protein EMIHUDRAFT_238518 [Emiliania huxleyi CCMP1516]EOD24391.1 hypothetical protein EMIHUDRAFT_238518 [Emiliania huxleyi CCMP1516]|eukprot:XP_005776820.1 hypothetical protein EMIHUDRAFT_238518 [Emiliania huxleyi CCMP1516]